MSTIDKKELTIEITESIATEVIRDTTKQESHEDIERGVRLLLDILMRDGDNFKDIAQPEKVIIAPGVRTARKYAADYGLNLHDKKHFNRLRIQSRRIEINSIIRVLDDYFDGIGDVDPAIRDVCTNYCEAYLSTDNKVAIAIEAPIKAIISPINAEPRMHCDDGPILEWADGSALFALNDITVPSWVVKQKTATAEQILSLTNVDKRTQAIKKFGIATLISEAKVLDAKGDYQLLDMGDIIYSGRNVSAPYLKMTSFSDKSLIHVEGVDPNCSTVDSAIEFRTGVAGWSPCLFDEVVLPDGNPSHYQQGDVCLLRDDTLSVYGLKRLDRDFVLSPETNIRHKLVGDYELYGDNTKQVLIARYVELQHPQHGVQKYENVTLSVFGLKEYDHILEMERAIED